ncbi:uncharacterized protein LOC113205158, partial [Frankliniella occidentalis]|uniref:Uncharacterized protein LOC113205158 n=1 Tax=Frankliniella occidentalis TaxID=133901 RepID=A0A9C6U5D8_FRAOC
MMTLALQHQQQQCREQRSCRFSPPGSSGPAPGAPGTGAGAAGAHGNRFAPTPPLAPLHGHLSAISDMSSSSSCSSSSSSGGGCSRRPVDDIPRTRRRTSDRCKGVDDMDEDDDVDEDEDSGSSESESEQHVPHILAPLSPGSLETAAGAQRVPLGGSGVGGGGGAA